MARPLRVEFPGAVYHVTSRGNARNSIYLSDSDRYDFLDVLHRPAHRVVQRYHWLCHSYCLMGNHYHFLFETPEANLSRGMRQLNVSTPNRLTVDITVSAICSRGAIKRNWWNMAVICWK